MAVQPFTKTAVGAGLGEIIQVTWVCATGDTGQPFAVPNNFDVTAHFYGTFGGGTVSLYGSNAASDFNTPTAPGAGNWVLLTDPQGNSIAKTAAAIESVLEMPLYIAPGVAAGTASLTTNVIMRRRA